MKNSVNGNVKRDVNYGVKTIVGLRGIAAGLLALAIAVEPIEAQAPVRVPVSVLQRYVGDYDQNGTTIKVSLSGDTLFREIPGQRIVLHPISETLFRMGPVFSVEFEVDQAGGVTQIVTGAAVQFRLPGKGARAPAPQAPPAASPPVRVPRAVLERYVGVYEFLPGQMSRTDLRVEVSLRGDTLIRSTGGNVVLTPISETLFRVAGTSLMTEFVIDEAGVTQVIGSGFQQLLARLQPKR